MVEGAQAEGDIVRTPRTGSDFFASLACDVARSRREDEAAVDGASRRPFVAAAEGATDKIDKSAAVDPATRIVDGNFDTSSALMPRGSFRRSVRSRAANCKRGTSSQVLSPKS
jgi:hypothetical protein